MVSISDGFKLNDQVKVPSIGLGTYMISKKEAPRCVFNALGMGYRHIDTAELYDNEQEIAKGIKKAMKSHGVSRYQLFLTSKVWPTLDKGRTLAKSKKEIKTSFYDSLKRLDTPYLDLYLIHAPLCKDHRVMQWEALLELKREGVVKSVGVSNYNIHHLKEIMAAGLPLPDVNQIELHPWCQQIDLVSFLRQKFIAVMAYSSLIPLASWRAVEGQNSAKTVSMTQEGLQDSFSIKQFAMKYDVSQAQLLLRWAHQKRYAVIPKSGNVQRMEDNLKIFDFKISHDDMLTLEGLDRGRGLAWSAGDPLQLG